MKKIIPLSIIQFLKIYSTAIFFFTIFRLILFFTEIDRIDDTVGYRDIFLSFVMGVRFDIVISSYILTLPFIIITIASFFKPQPTALFKSATYYIIILFSVAFAVCAIDIPYFNQFFSRFSVAAFEWADSPLFVSKMIIQEPRYWLFILPFLLITFLFYKVTRRVFLKTPHHYNTKIIFKILFSILFLGFIFVGIRGRLEAKSPIMIGTAYFSNNAFLNQLGLNPNFTLIRSYLDSRKEENKKIQLLDDSTAIANVRKYLNVSGENNPLQYSRTIEYDPTLASKHNVIVIIMESMSAAKMKRHGNTNNLTPLLDSISHQGYYFENAYTQGIHTFNGIFSTLFSFPALFRQHPMKESSMRQYHGIYSTLKANGYSTIYFTTHDGQFDNVEGFLKANGCETVISKPDYPAEKVKTTLGVPDDFMFEFSLPILNKLHQQGKPFFATLMTASDHGPYFIPEYFDPKNDDIKKQIVEYADYSLKKFIDLSSKQAWYKNTIFVFVADHGAPLDGVYNLSISYNHTPLLFYAPYIFDENKTLQAMAGQVDIFPTVMGLLQLSYVNNTLGIDLLKEQRPYIFFSADDKFGVIDDEWLLVVNGDKSKELFKYRNFNTHNFLIEKPDLVERMYTYATSNFQAFQYFLLKRDS